MLPIEKNQTASFDVDPQRGFTPLCPHELPVAGGEQIVAELNAQAQVAQLRVVSKDCHPAQAPWIAQSPTEIMQPVAGDYPNLDIKWPAHCVVGSVGNQLLPGLPGETEYDLVIEKGCDPEMHPYGACYHDLGESISTGVIEWLHAQGVTTVVLGGLATDYCVKTSALQLVHAGFRVIVNLAACRGVAVDSSAQAVDELHAAGVESVTSWRELVLA
ncbi:MAG: isochorismatase family protein [Desulfuromonas sp.]|nr:isochorismatase family protein [Desulfuromonas sp.]